MNKYIKFKIKSEPLIEIIIIIKTLLIKQITEF